MENLIPEIIENQFGRGMSEIFEIYDMHELPDVFDKSYLATPPSIILDPLTEMFPRYVWSIQRDGDFSVLNGAYEIFGEVSKKSISDYETIQVNIDVMNKMFPLMDKEKNEYIGYVVAGNREEPDQIFISKESFPDLTSLERSMKDFDNQNNPKLVNFPKYIAQNPDLDIAVVFGDGDDSENLFNLGIDDVDKDFIKIPHGYNSIHDLLSTNKEGLDLMGYSLSDVSKAMVRHPQILNWVSTFPSGTLISKMEMNAAIRTALDYANNS